MHTEGTCHPPEADLQVSGGAEPLDRQPPDVGVLLDVSDEGRSTGLR